MATLATLAALRAKLKGQVGIALGSDGNSDDPTLNSILSQSQLWLATEFDFQELKDRWDCPVSALAQFVNFPTTDIYGRSCQINFQRPLLVETQFANYWYKVEYGVGSPEYNTLNPSQGQSQDPIEKYDFAQQIGIPVPSALSLAQGAAGNPSGAYQYVMTFVTPYGESAVSAVASITVTSKQVTVTIPTDSTGLATSRKIYRTVASGSTFKLAVTVANNVATTATDNVADGSLGATLDTASSVTYYRQMEVWPQTASAQSIRFTGQRMPQALVNDTDYADLDDMLLVYLSAAEYLNPKDPNTAKDKLALFNARMQYLKQTTPVRYKKIGYGRRDETINRRFAPLVIVATTK